MEYAVPLDAGPDCLAAIRDLLRRDFPEMPFPIEYRTVAADDVWLSVAYERPTVTISLHMDAREDDEPLFRAAESLFTTFEGRRIGEKSTTEPVQRWHRSILGGDDWWDARDTLDPGGVFLNNALRRLRNG